MLTPGMNTCSNGSPRLQRHILRIAGGQQPQAVSCHAEIAALNRLSCNVTARHLRQCTLVVVRPSYNSETQQTKLLCARPCKECAMIIFRLGIKAVIYSDDGCLIRKTPADILSEAQASWGTKRLLRDAGAAR